MDSLEPKPFSVVPSAVPGEFGFVYQVPDTVLLGKAALTPLTTTYLQMVSTLGVGGEFQNETLAGYTVGTFIFMGWTDGAPGYLGAQFQRPITAAQAAVPLDSLGDTLGMERPWPAVLVFLGAREDHRNPLSVEIGGRIVQLPRLKERLHYIPEGVYSCKVVKKVYVSLDEFPAALTRTDVPVPMPIHWRERNIGGSLTCLHPDVTLPEADAGTSELSGWGTVGRTEPRQNGGSFYPATNHIFWRKHCYSADVRRGPDGQRVLTRMIAYPPTVRLLTAAS